MKTIIIDGVEYDLTPKALFKKGDWVVYCNEDVDLITGIEETGYLINKGGYIPFTCQGDMRLWTIQDAKDGDVLTTDTWTFIFKKYQYKSVYYHCAFSTFNNFSISDTGEFDSDYVHHANKEQRDLLFSKMKEAGYEWDADKKELKKIEQKTVSITDEWIENYWKHHKVNNPNSYDKGDEIQFDHDGFVRFCNKYFQKSAWSEEDEKIYKVVLEILSSWSKGTIGSFIILPNTDRYVNWLKSLKERMKGE